MDHRHLIIASLLLIPVLAVTFASRYDSPDSDPFLEGKCSFAALHVSDSIVVNFLSRGCFHYECYRMVFVDDSATNTDMPDTKINEADTEAGTSAEVIVLDEGDDLRLDALLDFYRSLKGEDFCTTTDSIHITQWRYGSVVAEESFIDRTCTTGEEVGGIELPSLEEFLHQAER